MKSRAIAGLLLAEAATFWAASLIQGGALSLEATPNEVAEKILRHSRDLGGLSRVTFQMNAASLPQGNS